MNWKWDELTAPDFVRAVGETQATCVLPLGALEKHGEHLPLGSDVIQVAAIAAQAVAREPALLFPALPYGQIQEAKHCPGTIALRHDLLTALLENVCEEIARNGLKKIVLLNGHGGNEAFLQLFTFGMLQKPRAFTLYVVSLAHYFQPVQDSPEWQALQQSASDAHAGEVETSVMLALEPGLVRLDCLGAPGERQNRLAHVPARTPVWWYADFPGHYAGDATAATPAKGAFLLPRLVERVATILQAIKADTEAPRLQAEFFARLQH